MTSPIKPPPLPLLISLVTVGPVSIDIFLPSLPDMTQIFATDVSHVQATLSIFIAGFALAQLVLGPLSDRFGRRPVLLGGILVYLTASIACLLAPSIGMLVAARLVQSFGACAGPVLSRAIVRDAFPRDQAARILATMASVMTIAPAVAPIAGGSLHALFGWRINFVVMVIFGIGLFTTVWFGLRETNRHPDRDALKIGRMIATYGGLIRQRHFMGHTLTLSLVFSGLFSFVSGGSFLLIGVLGVAPEHFGFCFATVVSGLLIGNLATMRLSHRLGAERMIGIGVAIGLSGGLVLAGLALAGIENIGAVIGPMFAVFLSSGLVMANGTAAAIAPYGRIAGSASALLGFLQMAFASTAGWLVGKLDNGTSQPMGIVIGVCLVTASLSFALLVLRRTSLPA